MTRLTLLKQFAEETPDDPFNFYAMALEYLKSDPVQAEAIFDKLVTVHTSYLPTYYPYAQLLIERNQPLKAEAIFKKGMEIAIAANETKTYREIQAAWNDWKDGI